MSGTFFAMGLAVGLMGFAHCAGMCGGIAAALALHGGPRGGLVFLVFYQMGRIAVYTLLGAGGAYLGGAILYHPFFATGAKTLLIASDVFVMLLGAAGLGLLPFPSGRLMSADYMARPIAGLIRSTSNVAAPVQGLLLGLVFGFLPCGLLYPVLISAIQSAEPMRGGLTMLGFGLGTAPALFFVGGAASRAGNLPMKILKAAWLVVIAMGAFNLYKHIQAWSVVGSCCS